MIFFFFIKKWEIIPERVLPSLSSASIISTSKYSSSSTSSGKGNLKPGPEKAEVSRGISEKWSNLNIVDGSIYVISNQKEFCLHHLLQWFRRQSIHPPQLLRVMAVWIQALSRNPMCPGECCQRCQSRNGPKMHPQTDFSFSLRDARDDATTYYCWCHPLLLLLRFPNYLLPLTSQAPPTQKPLKRDCSTTTHHKLLNYDFF